MKTLQVAFRTVQTFSLGWTTKQVIFHPVFNNLWNGVGKHKFHILYTFVMYNNTFVLTSGITWLLYKHQDPSPYNIFSLSIYI